ncbi:hypothetical protein PLESTF_000708300 [Pleodorina starrii]|nr:hypothetical protein PLESTF_000708300 [Pleodorina starrii]
MPRHPPRTQHPHHYWQRDGEDCGEAHGVSHFPSSAASASAAVAPTAWVGGASRPHRVHEATELAPLSCPVRLLLVPPPIPPRPEWPSLGAVGSAAEDCRGR